MKEKIMFGIVVCFGVFHALYGVLMLSESFLYGVMWLVFAFVELGCASFVLNLKKTHAKVAKVCLAALVSVLLVQSVLDAAILMGSVSFNTDRADQLIVLGYQLDNDQASETLLNRISVAYDYAKKNPESQLIVTGGTTGKNSKSEAEVMQSTLISLGIDSSRITLESEAKNTIDNMKLSKKFLSEKDKVVLITSNYHCLRAKVLAKKMGYSVKTIGSAAPWKLMLNQLFLEKVSLLQIFVFGV